MGLPIITVALVALIAISSEAAEWNGLVASWSLDTTTHFYNLPQTLAAAQEEGWTKISGVCPPSGSVGLGYQDDPTVVLIFDAESGAVYGIQVGFPQADVADLGQPMDYDNLPAVAAKTLNGVAYYTATVYFYSDDSSGERQLLFKEGDDLVSIPTNASLIASETDYLKKNCVPTMGGHFYALDYNTNCSTFNPLFILTDDDDVIGYGYQSFGSAAAVSNRTWFETLPYAGVLTTVPDMPVCGQVAIQEFGLISIHVWFVNDPVSLTC